MADKKISELDAITGADTAADDFFIVVDSSGSATKKISRAELNNAIERDVLDTVDINGGTIDGTTIGASSTAAGSFTTLQADTSLNVDGTVTADGLTVDGSSVVATFGNAASNNYAQIKRTTTNVATLTLGASSDLAQVTGGPALSLSTGAADGSSETRRMLISSGGDISFYDDTGSTQGFFWDASAERLGLGTTLPNNQLEIKSDTATVVARLACNTGSGRDYGVASNTTGGFGIYDYDASDYRFYIDSSGTVGIGKSNSLNGQLDVKAPTGDGEIAIMTGSITANSIRLQSGGSTTNWLEYRGYLGHAWFVDSTERMRIDSSGNLLVGKTASSTAAEGIEVDGANGLLVVTRDGNPTATFNRLTSDGGILDFRKDSTTVGSIGYFNSPEFVIGRGNNGVGFSSSTNSLYPTNPSSGSIRGDTMDLGFSTGRWKDLYLSGGVYLGGTGSANLLDDYEEGTASITLTPASGSLGTVNVTARYTKTGRMVVVVGDIAVGTVSSPSGALDITGLPFTSSSTTIRGSQSITSRNGFDTSSLGDGQLFGNIEASSTACDVMYMFDNGSTRNNSLSGFISTAATFNVTLIYFTD